MSILQTGRGVIPHSFLINEEFTVAGLVSKCTVSSLVFEHHHHHFISWPVIGRIVVVQS